MQKKNFKESKKYESQIKKVFDLKARSHFSKGIDLLKIMNNQFKNDKTILGLLGTLFYESKDYKNSSIYFKKALKANPNSELSSLGLFHSYFELGKINLALNEINRFIKENTPKLYQTTLQELRDNIDNFSKSERKIINNFPTVFALNT